MVVENFPPADLMEGEAEQAEEKEEEKENEA
jgi:hypothetical protein